MGREAKVVKPRPLRFGKTPVVDQTVTVSAREMVTAGRDFLGKMMLEAEQALANEVEKARALVPAVAEKDDHGEGGQEGGAGEAASIGPVEGWGQAIRRIARIGAAKAR